MHFSATLLGTTGPAGQASRNSSAKTRFANGRTRLFHVSEKGGIERFEPRIPPSTDAGIRDPVVWAVDQEHLANYLVPRDCPRVCFRITEHTTAEDREVFLGSGSKPVIVIESDWIDRASTTPLWVYEFAPHSFMCVDDNAGYFISSAPAVPIARRRIESPLREVAEMGVELRTVGNLRALAEAIAQSSLAFSGIRLRNAAHR